MIDSKVTSFKIKNLYGRDYEFPFEDNRLIIVGENGSGKSTVLDLFHIMMESESMDFDQVDVDEMEVVFESGQVLKYTKENGVNLHEFPSNSFSIFYCPPVEIVSMQELVEESEDSLLDKAFNEESYYYDPSLNAIYRRFAEDNCEGYQPKKHLSEGERRLLSIFYIVLYSPRDVFLVMDEPETSLSMEWQGKLLKELAALPNVKGFLVATHSPFIFKGRIEEEGETKYLSKYAVGMGQCRIG